MPRLLFHVGLGRAGSSWIQASLRTSTAALRNAGVEYPLLGEDPSDAAGLSSGNGREVVLEPRALARLLRRHAVEGHDLLFSSETLSHAFAAHPDIGTIVASARRAGFESVGLLLIVRDPAEHAASIWQLRVRSQAYTASLGQHVGEGYRDPTVVRTLLERTDATPGIDVQVHNYRSVRERLLHCVADFLGVPPATLRVPPVTRINRSLSRAELEWQLALNRVFGRDAGIVATRLVERNPDVPVAPRIPPVAAQRRMLERLGPDLAWLESRLPDAARLNRAVVAPPAEDAPGPLGPDQLTTIAEALGEMVARRSLRFRARRVAVRTARVVRTGTTGPAVHRVVRRAVSRM